MDRDALRGLSREDLVELVLGRQELVGMIPQLEARVAELAAELARRGGPPKTSENSSVPPSAGFKANRAERGRASSAAATTGSVGGCRRRTSARLAVHKEGTGTGQVTLTATPAAGSQFAGGSGACSGAAATCLVWLMVTVQVPATFVRP